MGRPSRMMKKSTNSMTGERQHGPDRAEEGDAAERVASCSNRCLLPSTSQACTWLVLISRFCSSQSMTPPTTGSCVSSSKLCSLLLPDPGLEPGREIRGLARERERERRHRTEEQQQDEHSSGQMPKSRRGRGTT